MSTTGKKILLLRHGTTDLVDSCLCGQMPGVLLNENGRQQAITLAARLASLDVLVSSPLERAWETASIIARMHGLEPVACEAFAERDFGRWTGTPFQDLVAGSFWTRLDTSGTKTAQNCESMDEVQRRALTALENIMAKEVSARTIAVVSHSAVVRALLSHAAGLPLSSYLQFTIHPASISEIGYGESDGFHVVRVNDCDHLA